MNNGIIIRKALHILAKYDEKPMVLRELYGDAYIAVDPALVSDQDIETLAALTFEPDDDEWAGPGFLSNWDKIEPE